MTEYMKECVNAHEFCAGSFPCPYCENKMPLRTEDGRFASWSDLAIRVWSSEDGPMPDYIYEALDD